MNQEKILLFTPHYTPYYHKTENQNSRLYLTVIIERILKANTFSLQLENYMPEVIAPIVASYAKRT
jgi:hypothetical protein